MVLQEIAEYGKKIRAKPLYYRLYTKPRIKLVFALLAGTPR